MEAAANREATMMPPLPRQRPLVERSVARIATTIASMCRDCRRLSRRPTSWRSSGVSASSLASDRRGATRTSGRSLCASTRTTRPASLRGTASLSTRSPPLPMPL